MCGGELDLPENVTFSTCAYCGTKITLPKVTDGRLENLYNRAEHFRRNNDDSKAPMRDYLSSRVCKKTLKKLIISER